LPISNLFDHCGVGVDVIDPSTEGYRCPDRGGPGGQRCQLLIQHEPATHIASIRGVVRGWVDGREVPLPPSPYRWAVSFPRDED
jgi:hypothetical protein